MYIMPDHLSTHEYFTLATLFYVNILNYMDRFTIAAILGNIKEEFQIGDDLCGLLQTGFIVSYTICAPIFGYLGDRYSRLRIIIASLLLWSAATVVGSFMRTYGWFFFMRTIVGMGEAGFSSLAPTIIYDITYKNMRKNALALFYLAIPLGAGLGFVVASKATVYAGHWSWGMRVSPILALLGVVLLCLSKNPLRGEWERRESGSKPGVKTTTYRDDLKILCKNASYILSTLGFTSVTFVTGALAWWGATFLHYGFRLIPGGENLLLSDIAFYFGALGVITGLIGVPMGTYASQKLNKRYLSIDPIICGFGVVASDPFIAAAFLLADKSIALTFAAVFCGQILLNSTWTIMADIVLSVVIPEMRSTAEAVQITFGHAFGDAGSPYLVGLVSEILKASWAQNQPAAGEHTKLIEQFEALQYALYCILIVQFIGGIAFISNAYYIVEDRQAVLRAIENPSQD